MLRKTFPLSVLALFLLVGCGIIQDPFASQKGGLSTPTETAAPKQQGVLDAAAARKAASPYQGRAAQPTPSVAQQPQPRTAKIGLLVPLSGRSAALGQSMVNAAQLAVFDMGMNGFELMPRDTKGTADGATAAARDVMDKGAELLIGPLFAADVSAVKPVAQAANKNMLALSTDVSLATSGTYVMGFAPAPQVERVVSYASKHGIHNYAALIPTGPYGQLVSKAFGKAVRDNGGVLIDEQPLSNVAALATQKDRIEAIFLPLGGGELRSVVAQLEALGFQSGQVRLLGTGLWDEPDIAQGQALLFGGWFAASEPGARTKFVQSYEAAYGQKPPRLATLAYDATALAAVLARSGAPYDVASLTNPSGFAGVDGVFRLNPDGQIERALAVLEVASGENQVIDPAPLSFLRR